MTTKKELKLSLTDFNAKPDLKYIDIEFNSVNEITCPLDTFTDSDVGKLIAIKDTHHNPNTADGTEYPNSQLGRIVTVTTKITAVNNGVATIDFSCNLTANARAYSYTNNFDALQDAINYAQENYITTIVRDGKGIYGTNPLFSEKYLGAPALVVPNTYKLEIVGIDENPFKFCVEDTTVARDFIQIKQGNSDFTLDGKILPPDRYSTMFPILWSVVNTNWNNQYAGNSVREVCVKNIGYVGKEDTDGNDSWFCYIILNTRGGLDNDKNKQILTVENINVRHRFAVFSSFNQHGNYCTLYHNDFNAERWSSHYTGERGREDYDNSTLETLNDDGGKWKFNLAFTVSGGVLTIDDINNNFSFYDYRTDVILASGRVLKIYLSSSPTTGYTTTATNNSKSVNIEGLADGNYNEEWVLSTGYGNYGHPVYHHPNQDMYFDNFKQLHDNLWINSSGGVPNLTNNIIKIENSKIKSCKFGGTDYKINLDVENSSINVFALKANSIFLKNAILKAGDINTNYFKSFGNNIIGTTLRVREGGSFESLNDTFTSSLYFYEKINVVIDDYLLPVNSKYCGRIICYNNDSTVMYKNCKKESYINLYFTGTYEVIYKDNFSNKGSVNHLELGEIHNKIKFINNNFSLNFIGSGFLVNNYLKGTPFNRIDVSNLLDRGGKVTTSSIKNTLTKSKTFGWYLSKLADIQLNFNISNYFYLDSVGNYGLAFPRTLQSADATYRNGGYSSLAIYKGLVYIEITDDNQLQVLSELFNYNDSAVARNCTYNNILVKTLERRVGEIVTFEITPNAFLKEISSNMPIKYVDTIPSNRGVHLEKVFLNSKISYVYYIETEILNDYTDTVILSDGLGMDGYRGDKTIDCYVIETGKVFTIGQNFSDGNITPFSFKIILDNDEEIVFVNDGLHNLEESSSGHEVSDLVRYLWMYTAMHNSNRYAAYVDNLNGKIYISKNNTITLKATDNLIINGLEVVSENWYRNYEKEGIEVLTTVERIAVLDECIEGYEVYDKDLSVKFIKNNNEWVSLVNDTNEATNLIVEGSILGFEQEQLAKSGQPGLTVLAVGFTTSGKVQGTSLGDGNVVEVYASGADFNLGTVLYREFMSLGEPICFTGLSNGAIITSTQGFYGMSEQTDNGNHSPMPLLSYGLSFKSTFLYAFRDSNEFGQQAQDRGFVHVVNGPLSNSIQLTNGSGTVIQGQEDIALEPWQHYTLETDANSEFILEGTNNMMACIHAAMSNKDGVTSTNAFYDSRLIMPLTNDGITWPRSGFVSAPYTSTSVDYFVRDNAKGNFTVNPGSPIDFDGVTGADDPDYEPNGATRILATGLVSAYSGADTQGLEATPLMPTSAMSQVVAQPFYVKDAGDGGDSGVAIASPYRGTAKIYEWNDTTKQLDLAYTVPLNRNGVTISSKEDQNHPAAGLVANDNVNGSVILQGDLNPGIIIADVPITVVCQSATQNNISLRSENGTTTTGIATLDDETLMLGWTPETLKAEIKEGADGVLYKRVVAVGGIENWEVA